MGESIWCSPNPQKFDPSHSRVEYTQYVKHLRKDFDIDVSHFHKNIDAMADGYLKGVSDAVSRLRAVFNFKLGASGFG